MSEAAQLQTDLRRAGIEPFAWVINASMAASGTKRSAAASSGWRASSAQIERVKRDHAKRLAIVPWMKEAPVGLERLRELAEARAPAGLGCAGHDGEGAGFPPYAGLA